ncbi:MAG: hypothetical protein K940chlam7_00822, partial [Chlamydiae bacterium]|nr:hypothetical protein [Chlamydiota bacterium]
IYPSFTFTPPVPLTLHRGLAPFGATAPLKFYISFRCTNKTAEEDIFVEKNLCKTARTSPRTPKFISLRARENRDFFLGNSASLFASWHFGAVGRGALYRGEGVQLYPTDSMPASREWG